MIISQSSYNIKADLCYSRNGSSDGVTFPDWTNTTRSASQHQVPRLQGEVVRDEADEGGDAEDHVLGVAILSLHAIDPAPQVDVVRVGDGGEGDEVTDWETCVKHLCHGPRRSFSLGFILKKI